MFNLFSIFKRNYGRPIHHSNLSRNQRYRCELLETRNMLAASDVLIVLDESGTEFNTETQDWIASIVDDLHTALSAESIDVRYGLIDGFGNEGWSLAQTIQIVIPTLPEKRLFQIEFHFDRQVLGYLPNAFGLVWTDGSSDSRLSINLLDENGARITFHSFDGLGDELHRGGTQDDVFVGVIADAPFARILFTSSVLGNNAVPMEIDHVQYGLLSVPEPSSAWLLLLSAVMIKGRWILIRCMGRSKRKV